MTHKTNKNLFGMTVTALNGKVVSCAHMEPQKPGRTYHNRVTNYDYFPELGNINYN